MLSNYLQGEVNKTEGLTYSHHYILGIRTWNLPSAACTGLELLSRVNRTHRGVFPAGASPPHLAGRQGQLGGEAAGVAELPPLTENHGVEVKPP